MPADRAAGGAIRRWRTVLRQTSLLHAAGVPFAGFAHGPLMRRRCQLRNWVRGAHLVKICPSDGHSLPMTQFFLVQDRSRVDRVRTLSDGSRPNGRWLDGAMATCLPRGRWCGKCQLFPSQTVSPRTGPRCPAVCHHRSTQQRCCVMTAPLTLGPRLVGPDFPGTGIATRSDVISSCCD